MVIYLFIAITHFQGTQQRSITSLYPLNNITNTVCLDILNKIALFYNISYYFFYFTGKEYMLFSN